MVEYIVVKSLTTVSLTVYALTMLLSTIPCHSQLRVVESVLKRLPLGSRSPSPPQPPPSFPASPPASISPNIITTTKPTTTSTSTTTKNKNGPKGSQRFSNKPRKPVGSHGYSSGSSESKSPRRRYPHGPKGPHHGPSSDSSGPNKPHGPRGPTGPHHGPSSEFSGPRGPKGPHYGPSSGPSGPDDYKYNHKYQTGTQAINPLTPRPSISKSIIRQQRSIFWPYIRTAIVQ